MEKEFYTAEEVSEKLSVSLQVVWRWIREGRLEAVTFGNSTYKRIPQQALDKFLKSTIEEKADE